MGEVGAQRRDESRIDSLGQQPGQAGTPPRPSARVNQRVCLPRLTAAMRAGRSTMSGAVCRLVHKQRQPVRPRDQIDHVALLDEREPTDPRDELRTG